MERWRNRMVTDCRTRQFKNENTIVAEVNAVVEHFVFKTDYCKDEYKTKKVTDWNDEYILIATELPLTISKVIKVSIEKFNINFKIDGFDEIVVNSTS